MDVTNCTDDDIARRAADICNPDIRPKDHHIETDILLRMHRRKQAAARRVIMTHKLTHPPARQTKLTIQQMNDVIRRYRTGTITIKKLAEEYGVAQGTINNITKKYISAEERAKIGKENTRRFYDDKRKGKGETRTETGRQGETGKQAVAPPAGRADQREL